MSNEIIDEQEWLKSVMSEYKEILRQKYGDDNFSFFVITLTCEDCEGSGVLRGVTYGHSSKELRACAMHCKELLARLFAYEKALTMMTGLVMETQEVSRHED